MYKATRNLLHWTGDTGAFLRSAMGALVLFGAPPEEYWPYDISTYDEEPPAFCYAFAQSFQAIKYVRLDPPGTEGADVVDCVKQFAASGFPSMFGFTVYSSIAQADDDGKIPMPAEKEKVEGGHAIVARRIRRQDEGHEHDRRVVDDRCVQDPQFVGRHLGRRRVRMAPVRLRHLRASPTTGGR